MKTIILVLLCVSSIAFGQAEEEYDDSRDTEIDTQDAIPNPVQKAPAEVPLKKTAKGEWIIAPIPNYSPAQGWGLALAVENVSKNGGASKPSIVGGALFGTEKKSYGGMFMYVGRLNDDELRLNVFAGYAKINSDFYGVGKGQSGKDLSVLLEQEAKFAMVQLTPRWGPVYIGPTLMFMNIQNKFDIEGLPPGINSSNKLDEVTWVPGLKLQADTRDNSFYPLSGYLTNFSVQFHDQNISGDYTFQEYRVNHNFYIQLGKEQVLATRLNVEDATGDVPFYDMPSFGQGADMRGYKAGKYRDKFIWDAQTEYRLRFTDRWGGVAFAGAGDVLPSAGDISLNDLLWSGGIGARFRIARDNPVDFRVDLARGDNEWSVYFSVNQAY